MKTAIFPLAIVLALAMTPGLASANSTPAPVGVQSFSVGPTAVVTWTPAASSEIVTYNVYGVTSGGGLTLLETTVTTAAEVVGGYASYAVTAVGENGESDPTYAANPVCVYVNPFTPPFVFLCSEIG